jgi:DNA topoisomerase-1
MRTAQRLYEQGLITYHRTDSFHIAAKAITAVRKLIPQQFGKQYLPDKPNYFKTKSKLAQEAHEAIRPTNVSKTSAPLRSPSPQSSKTKKGSKNPKNASNKFSNPSDQTKLYNLIWQRFVACQMAPAVWDETRVTISANLNHPRGSTPLDISHQGDSPGVKSQASNPKSSTSSSRAKHLSKSTRSSQATPPDYTLTASGRTEKFLGWRRVYHEDRHGQNRSRVAGPNSSNQVHDPGSNSHQDQVPVSRHSELVSESKSSSAVNHNQENTLPPLNQDQLLDLLKVTSEQKFTQPPPRYGVASLIKQLEKLGIGRPSTYAPIISTIQDRQYVELVEKSFVPTPVGFAVTEFLLKNFPQVMDYQFTAGMEANLDQIAQGDKQWVPIIRDFYTPFSDKLVSVEENSQRVKIATEKTGDKCPECQKGDVVIRVGRFGKFLSCSRFPECKYTANFVEKIDMKCPKCGEGEVIIKTTKKRRKFFGCSRYPKCDWASWKKPQAST